MRLIRPILNVGFNIIIYMYLPNIYIYINFDVNLTSKWSPMIFLTRIIVLGPVFALNFKPVRLILF